MSKILVTGAAGFIGFHLSRKLLERGDSVVGLDNLNDYYDPSLKAARLKQLEDTAGFVFYQADLENMAALKKIFEDEKVDYVVNLSAQAGVRYSITNPHAYIKSNIDGFINVLECCRHHKVKHLVYASSSSVYGANTKMPFSVHDVVDHPVSLYAATKKSNELMAHTYSSLYALPTTGLRFFTVYGPWGRPDMALFLFTDAILNNRPIDVFNHGKMRRDFTYIDDIIEGVVRVLDRVPRANPDWNGDAPDPATSYCPYRVFNIGNNNPVELMHMITTLETCLGRKAEKNMLPLQKGDVPATYADVEALEQYAGFKPATSIEDGVAAFVKWYRQYYGV